jgi:hypothetical protein
VNTIFNSSDVVVNNVVNNVVNVVVK